MRVYNVLSLVFLFISVIGCGNSTNNQSGIEGQTENGFEDGTYCADVEYYNSNTGTNSTYSLEVEIYSNQVIQINWGNGGWLDEDHFTAEELDSDGSCSFTSDQGYDYNVSITGRECSSTDVSSFESDRQDEQEDLVEATDDDYIMLMSDCATALKLSEKELSAYEKDFNVSRTDMIRNNLCELMNDYICEIRALQSNMNNLNAEVENGKIERVYAFSMYNSIACHQIIAKKRGVYYWLEVRGNNKCKMGTIEFNINTTSWQETIVKESPYSSNLEVYFMKLMGQSQSLSLLNGDMEKYCLGVI